MANDQAVAAAQDLKPKPTAALEGMQLLGIALFTGEDALRKVMQRRPYAVIAAGLVLGAIVGLLPLHRLGKTYARER